jgi:asparagine synthase (glutamine-hydrolysing)
MESVAELLQLRFTTGAETVFGGIRRVLPGETLLIADGAVVERHRRPALPEGGPEPITEADALARLDAALAESVARQHRHGEVGLLLSGGIASCVLSRVLQRLGAGSVLALTATLDHPNAAGERERAEAVARAAGARHAVLTLTDDMVWRDLPNIVAAMDDPVAEEGIIPAWFLARRAREEGVGLVLSGAGGDALLAGDGRYRAATRPWWFGGRPMHGLGGFDRLPGLLREVPSGWRDGIAAAEVAAATPGRSRLQRAQAVDMAEWLPNALLTRLDRCLATHGVEGGAPFLDPGVVAAAFRLPDALKQRGGTGMWLLRAWLAREAPGSQPFHRRRRFGLPLGTWIAGIGARLGPLVAAQPGVFEIAQPDRVEALFRDAARHRHAGVAAWRLLFYALWHRRHMEGRVPGAGQDTCDYLTG